MAAQDLAQQLVTNQLFLTPTQQQKLQAYQNEKQMADALQAQGLQPIDTNNRMMGQIAYKISPMEGIAKIAQALAGAYGEKNAQADYGQIMQPDVPTDNAAGNSSGDNSEVPQAQTSPLSGSNPFVNADGSPSRIAIAELLGGNRAVGEFIKPTNEQKNFGNQMPQYVQNELGAGSMRANPGVASQQSAAGTALAQNAPLGALQGMASGNQNPTGGTPDPQTASALQAYRQQNGMPTPPIDSQRAGAGLPVGIGSSLPMGAPITQGIPPVNASALQPHQAVASPPPIDPNMTAAQNAAQLEAWKAGQIAQGAVKPAGDKASAEKSGENAAEAAKTLNVMAQNLPVLQNRIQAMSDANKASTFGPWNDSAGDGLATKIQDLRNNPASIANAKLQQLTAQNVLPELGPALAQAGIKGNKFLETLSSTASGVDLGKGQQARQAQIDGLLNNYVQNMKSTYNQVKQYGGDPSTVFADPQSVANAVKLGVIPRDEGISILQRNHGFK